MRSLHLHSKSTCARTIQQTVRCLGCRGIFCAQGNPNSSLFRTQKEKVGHKAYTPVEETPAAPSAASRRPRSRRSRARVDRLRQPDAGHLRPRLHRGSLLRARQLQHAVQRACAGASFWGAHRFAWSCAHCKPASADKGAAQGRTPWKQVRVGRCSCERLGADGCPGAAIGRPPGPCLLEHRAA